MSIRLPAAAITGEKRFITSPVSGLKSMRSFSVPASLMIFALPSAATYIIGGSWQLQTLAENTGTESEKSKITDKNNDSIFFKKITP